MKRNVCVVTGTRAEFGLLLPLLKRINDNQDMHLRLVVTGSHLGERFGHTVDEIDREKLPIHAKLPIPLEGDSKADMARATGAAIQVFAEYFQQNRPDLLIVLGDRFEIFAAASSAAILGIPIAHIHGGETTEGAVDEFFRHSITKMSFLHFTSCEVYRQRVIQLGEDPKRVFNVGALSVENILTLPLLNLENLNTQLPFNLQAPFSIVTFHPVTQEDAAAEKQIRELIAALSVFPDMMFLITKANADAGGRLINQVWDEEAKAHINWAVVPSLGVLRYLSALKYAKMVIGNSSSGMIEAPAFHIPTVNIGDRQKGRIQSTSIINCPPEKEAIIVGMQHALDPAFNEEIQALASPFGDGATSTQILHVIREFLRSGVRKTQKPFYDIR